VFYVVQKREPTPNIEVQQPILHSEKRIVRGNSMNPLLEDGDVVEIFLNYNILF